MALAAAEQAPKAWANEVEWQERWRSRSVFRVPPKGSTRGRDTYVLVSCPFTSGSAHLGHARSYSIADAYARFRRSVGDAVLFSIGYDAFGLPAEIRAAHESMEPHVWVERCASQMNEQFEALGFSFDWDRVFLSSDPDVYKWSQWLFLLLREIGLIARREAPVDWCEGCETTLSPSQADGGSCWRCHQDTTVIFADQWFLDLSSLCDENADRVEGLVDWNKLARGAQRSLLGQVRGTEAELIDERGRHLTVFAEADLESADAAAMSPQHLDLGDWIDERTRDAIVESVLKRRRSGSDPFAADLIDTGHRLRSPGQSGEIPLFVSTGVNARYGASAALLRRQDGEAERAAGSQVLVSTLGGRPATRYRVTAFPISRQRSWGAPIPIINCPECGPVAVPKSDLPVRLPEHGPSARDGGEGLDPGEVLCRCPRCRSQARPETDTLDCHFDATWQQVPLAVPTEDRGERMFDHPELDRWFPVAQYVHGADIGGFVLDERALSKLLRDLGRAPYLGDGEPYKGALMHGMVKLDGRKMSKHLNNSVDPSELVARYGADAVRFGLLHAAAPSRDITWNEGLVENAELFLARVIAYSSPRLERARSEPADSEIDRGSKRRRQLLLWCEKGQESITDRYGDLDMHLATRALFTLFSRIEDFGARTAKDDDPLGLNKGAELVALTLFAQLLAPVAPHTAEQLWRLSGRPGLVVEAPWPDLVGDGRLAGSRAEAAESGAAAA